MNLNEIEELKSVYELKQAKLYEEISFIDESVEFLEEITDTFEDEETLSDDIIERIKYLEKVTARYDF